MSDKQLNRLVTQKTNHSDDNNGIVGTWTVEPPNPIELVFPETGPTSYHKLELTKDKLLFVTSFNSDFSDPIAYINTEYKLVDNTIEINMASTDNMYLIPGYQIPGISDEGGLGAHKIARRTFIFVPSSDSVYYNFKASIINKKETEFFKSTLTDYNWNILPNSAEYYLELKKTM